MLPNTVQATRGCKRVCDFCTVNAVWPRYLKRPVADVVHDVRNIQGEISVSMTLAWLMMWNTPRNFSPRSPRCANAGRPGHC